MLLYKAIVGGKLADRFGSKVVLVSFLILGFQTLTMLSFKPSMFMLYLLLAIAGGTTTGTQIITNAYVSQYYPYEIVPSGQLLGLCHSLYYRSDSDMVHTRKIQQCSTKFSKESKLTEYCMISITLE
ncbi:hypothetical protein ACIQXR_12970 [Peribacillus sp. NPDC097224]|uniref:hypothetical protein n=1 Tax=unclassified Peribacillus TaxID=2675266 RepID=UPI003817B34B